LEQVLGLQAVRFTTFQVEFDIFALKQK
jgi:hypothetical protein